MLYHCYRNRCTIVTENDASLLLILMYSILPKMMYFSLPITSKAAEAKLTAEERKAKCLEISYPTIHIFEKWMLDTYPTILPKSKIGKPISPTRTLSFQGSPGMSMADA